MGRTVEAPDGRVWTVRRRWIPRLGTETVWGRFRRRIGGVTRRVRGSADAAEELSGKVGYADDVVGAVVAVVVVVLLVAAAVFFVIPLLVVLVDLLVLVVLALLALIARVALRRPWLVDAHDAGGAHLRWRIVGWRASGAKVDEIADVLASGVVPPDGEVLAARDEGEPDAGR